jgi:hypothetical protein
MWGVWLSNTCVLGEWLSGPLVISGDRASRIRQAACADKNIPNGNVVVVFLGRGGVLGLNSAM